MRSPSTTYVRWAASGTRSCTTAPTASPGAGRITQVVGCEVVYLVDVLTQEQADGENTDADTEADG